MRSAPASFVSFGDDGIILEVNERLGHVLGYAPQELLGRHMEAILPPGARIFYHTHVFPLLKLQGSVEEIHMAFRARDGADIPMLINGVRREREGRFVSDCVCMRMIRRHEYEDQLLLAQRIAEEANAAKAKFLSMMSHDLRTPLTAIYGYAELIRQEASSPAQAETAETIREACRTLMTMIGDILEFARLDSGRVQIRPATVPVHEAISRAESLIRMQAGEAGLLFVGIACHPDLQVTADPDRLQQILLNLLTNALKFTPPGGRIAVGCDHIGDRVLIHVSDTGIGIPADQIERIFSPFIQLDAISPSRGSVVRRGVGLGLAISRDLARAMNGELTAAPAPEGGSVFTIDLPAAPATSHSGMQHGETVSPGR